jgi:hypothetical protein
MLPNFAQESGRTSPQPDPSRRDCPPADLDSSSVESGSARVQLPSAVRRGWNLSRATLRLVALCSCIAIGLAIALLAVVQFRHETHLSADDPAAAADARIPVGACVLTDVSSFTIVADRFFSTHRSCPQMIDSIGTDYALGDGRNVLVGAARSAAVRRAWLSAFERAQFVWLNCVPVESVACAAATGRRIPWTPAISAYFRSHFRVESGQPQFLFVRDHP